MEKTICAKGKTIIETEPFIVLVNMDFKILLIFVKLGKWTLTLIFIEQVLQA